MMRLLLMLIILCAATILPAQSPSLQFECRPDSVRLGAAFECDCTLSLPSGAKLNSLYLPLDSIQTLASFTMQSDTIPAEYEILDYGQWRAAKNNQFAAADLGWKANPQNGFDVYFNTLKVMVWSPGYFKLPGLQATINWNNAGYDVFSNELILKIGLPDQAANVDSTGMAPIKPIILTQRSWTWLYWAIGLGLLAILLGYLLWRYLEKNKRENKPVEKEIIIPAHIIAFRELDKIEKQGDWLKGELKKYYDELTHVLRQYLENRYQIPALESTTDEILRDLKKTDLPDKYKRDMQRLLPMSDMVKFAKAMPHEEEHRGWLNWVRELVQHTLQEIINEEEKETSSE